MKTAKYQERSLQFALGAVLVLCAATYSYVEQSVSFLPIAVAMSGLLLLLFSLLYKDKAKNKTLGFLAWEKAGVIAAVIAFSAIFLAGVNYVSNRFEYRWDVTLDKQHTLTQATEDFIREIQVPVELTAFYVGLPPQYLQDLLNEYERVSSGRITATIVDPIGDIGAAAEFGNVISGEERKLIVVAGAERRDVDFSTASLSEEQITNALARITREPRQAYFLTGHSERSATSEKNEGFSLFVDLLNANNISSKDLMLGTERKIPEDCDVLIVAGPRTQLTDEEQELVNSYLEQGGDALFLIEAVVVTSSDKALTADQFDKNPSLNSILNYWGINIGNDIVVDMSSHIGGDQGSPATKNYGDHKEITQGLDYTFYIRPRSITALNSRRPTIELAPIAHTASKENSWAETDRTLNIRYDRGVDIPGPVAMSYVIWEGKEKTEESDTRIIVFTDADFLSNAYINQYSNAAMGINIVNWLSELDYAVFNEQKNIKVERLELTSKQRRIVTALLFLMPLLIGLTGVFVRMRP